MSGRGRAVEIGQHDVEHDEIEASADRLVGALEPAPDGFDLVALRGERDLEPQADPERYASGAR